jgi:hypothetical protein
MNSECAWRKWEALVANLDSEAAGSLSGAAQPDGAHSDRGDG